MAVVETERTMEMSDFAERYRRQRELADRLADERADKLLSQRGNCSPVETERRSDLPPLTPELASREGVGAYTVEDIVRVFRVSRATAYRWKKANRRVPLLTICTKNHKILHIDRNAHRRPSDPNFDVIKQAYSVFHRVRRKLDPNLPVSKDCYDLLQMLRGEVDLLIADFERDYGYAPVAR